VTLAAVVLLALVALLGASPADAARPKPCPPGTGEQIVGKKRSCVPLARLVPLGVSATPSPVALVQMGLLGPLEHRFERAPFLPQRVAPAYRRPDRRAEPVVDTRGLALARRLSALVGVGSASRALAGGGVSVNAPAPTVTSSGNTVSATGTYTVADPGSGVTTKVGLGVQVERDANGVPIKDSAELTLDTEFAKKGAGTIGFGVTIKLNGKLALKSACPTAAGAVEAKGSDSVRLAQSQAGTAFGIDFIRTETRITGQESYTGTVGPDAQLESVEYSLRRRSVVTRSASFLGGLIKQDWTVTITADASGRLDGRSGKVSAGDVHVTIQVRDRDPDAASTAKAKLENDQELRRRLQQEVADAIEHGYQLLKGAEKGWQTPNTCATMAFDPTTDVLAPGATRSVKGRVSAKNGGDETEARWDAATARRGRVGGGLPGSSSPGGPVQFDAVGDAPDANGSTVDLHLRATSRAGVAEADWKATVPAYTMVLTVNARRELTTTWAYTTKATATIVVNVDPRVATGSGGIGPMTFSDGAYEQLPGDPCAVSLNVSSLSGTVYVAATFEASADGPRLVLQWTSLESISWTEPNSCNPPGQSYSGLENFFVWQRSDSVLPRVTVPGAGGTASGSWAAEADPDLASGTYAVTVTPRTQ
jgi:hypothetical protein